jgi:hypothetical protein
MLGTFDLKTPLHTNLVRNFIALRVPVPSSSSLLTPYCQQNKPNENFMTDILIFAFPPKNIFKIFSKLYFYTGHFIMYSGVTKIYDRKP